MSDTKNTIHLTMLDAEHRTDEHYLDHIRITEDCLENAHHESLSHTVDPHGFMKVACIVPEVSLGNPQGNATTIIGMLTDEYYTSAKIIVTPELALTSYTCGDLFFQSSLLAESKIALRRIVKATQSLDKVLIVGTPFEVEGKLFNCAAVIAAGKIHGIVPKTHIPNYQEFYEKRWFSSALDNTATEIDFDGDKIPFGTDLLFKHLGATIGIEICEDLWTPMPPSTALTLAGADIIVNLSASNETIGKHSYLLQLLRQQSARCRCAYLYSSAGSGESSTDLVFAGNAIICQDGNVLAASERFARGNNGATATIDIMRLQMERMKYNSFATLPEELRNNIFRKIKISDENIGNISTAHAALLPYEPEVERFPFVPSSREHLEENCKEIIAIQSWGLEQRLLATGCRRLVIGISGGLDSTLALLIAAYTFRRLNFDLSGIIGVTMPGEATSNRTHNNALDLMQELGVTSLEIPIGKAVAQHFSDIRQDPDKHDAAYENSQARERTQILMDLANKENAMVLGTGDMSELALGWCTYNGDHMSMYGVNAGVPKTLVKHLVNWFADSASDPAVTMTLKDIINTPISPELIPAAKGQDGEEIAQKTEDLVGPYELHDFFLYYVLRHGFSPSKIFRLCRKAYEGIYDDATIKKWLVSFYRRFFSQQFKRSCLPDGPKVGSVCLSPRGDWRMPSDAVSILWKSEAENIPV